MSRRRYSQKERAHKAPGSLIYTGEKYFEKVKITLIRYNESSFDQQDYEKIEDCIAAIDPNRKNWIDVEGLHEVHNVEMLGKQFNLHPLLLEDVLNVHQRPKIDDYEELGYLYMVALMLHNVGAKENEIITEQVSFVLLKNILITFQEKPGDVFDPVRDRLRKGGTRIRSRNLDYLAYALLDSIVDNYFLLLESIGNELERMEEQLLDYKNSQITLPHIYEMKRHVQVIRIAVWPMREMFSNVVRDEYDMFEESTLLFMRDLYDHTVRVMEQIENDRDVVTSLYDMYMANVNQRLNEVIKVLTIISTIFIPLTFLVGVYGMNFDNMPELHTKYGYFAVLGVMVLMAVAMYFFFRKKRWV